MYQALYRTYRPEVFGQLLGQEHIVRILSNQLMTEQVGHAYLLCGTRGTGKTTVARLLAKGVNCLSDGERPCGECANCIAIRDGNFMDVVEIDAASNNSVDNIRDINESVKYPPVVGRMKVYIIDEVHMLSPGAFNALLKTLEEPPEHVMFILATTEPQKILATIMSRCMRLDFRRVPESALREGMRHICDDKGINITDGALGIIVSNGDGSVRDCLSMLDQCIAIGSESIDRDDVLEILGASGEETFIELTHLVSVHKVSDALLLLNEVLAEGKEIRQFMRDWMAHYRNILISKFVGKADDMINMSAENIQRLREQSGRMELPEINRAIMELAKTISTAKNSTQPRVLLELAIVKLASSYDQVSHTQTTIAAGHTPIVPESIPDSHRNQIVNAGSGILTKSGNIVNTRQDNTGDEVPISLDIDEARADNTLQTENLPEEGIPVTDNMEDAWYSIFDDSNAKGSFNLIRRGAVPGDYSEGILKVNVKNNLIAKVTEDNRPFIEEILSSRCGHKVAIQVTVADATQTDDKETRLKNAAKEASDKLGLNVKCE